MYVMHVFCHTVRLIKLGAASSTDDQGVAFQVQSIEHTPWFTPVSTSPAVRVNVKLSWSGWPVRVRVSARVRLSFTFRNRTRVRVSPAV